eukprot:1670725-Alexandrium_andersonii.AAC.1
MAVPSWGASAMARTSSPRDGPPMGDQLSGLTFVSESSFRAFMWVPCLPPNPFARLPSPLFLNPASVLFCGLPASPGPLREIV